MKRKAIGFLALLVCIAGAAHGQVFKADDIQRQLPPATQKLLASYALSTASGEYQAMRNTAFTWSTDAARQDPRAATVGCAWYAQIIQRHGAKANAGDASNQALYCSKISREELQTALGLSMRIGKELDAVQSGAKAPKSATF